LAQARRATARLKPRLAGRRVILLGCGVAHAFGFARFPVLTWTTVRWGGLDTRVSIVPHPSGVNTWWNDADNIEAASRFLRAAVAHGSLVRKHGRRAAKKAIA
jgi:hypothetical protein